MTQFYSLLVWADGDASNWQDSICSEAAAAVLWVYLIVILEDKVR